MVPVGEVDRTVRDDGVEQLPGRQTALEALHRPAAAGDPLLVGVGVGVGADPLQVVGHPDGSGEVADGQLGAAEDGVDVRVLEARQQQLAGEVDDLGVRADQVPDLVVADRGDPAAGDGQTGRPGAGGVAGVHGAAGEDQIGLGHGWCSVLGWYGWCGCAGCRVRGAPCGGRARARCVGVHRTRAVSRPQAFSGAPAASPRKYAERRRQRAQAAAGRPVTIISTTTVSSNQPLSAESSKWSVES